MKKVLSILLALIMIFAFAACGKDDEKVLTMVTEGTFPPYEYYDGEELIGIDVEIAKAICDKLGYKLEIVDTAFNTIIPGVESKKYDFAMAGITVNEERLEKVNFSDSYATGIQVVIVKEDSKITSVDDLFVDGANNVVGTQSGTTGNLYASDDIEGAGYGTVLGYEKTTDAIAALLTGKCDCVILDNEPAKALVTKNAGLKILDTEYANEDYAIAFNKDDTKLKDDFNDALKSLKADGSIKKIVDKYIK